MMTDGDNKQQPANEVVANQVRAEDAKEKSSVESLQ